MNIFQNIQIQMYKVSNRIYNMFSSELLDYRMTFGVVISITVCSIHWNVTYRNFPKFSDRQVWANSADPDQTAPREAVWSGSTLFAIPSASFGRITLRKCHLVQLLGWLQQILWVSEYLGN